MGTEWTSVPLLIAGSTEEVSPKATTTSKVMARRLTRRSTRANLAILDLVLDSNPRIRKAVPSMGMGMPCVRRSLSFSAICRAASRTRARSRSSRLIRLDLEFAAPLVDNPLNNPPAAAPRSRCRPTISQNHRYSIPKPQHLSRREHQQAATLIGDRKGHTFCGFAVNYRPGGR